MSHDGWTMSKWIQYENLNASVWYIYRIYLLFNQSYDIKWVVSLCADFLIIFSSQQEY